MVVFVDLEDEAEPPELKIGLRWPTTSTSTSTSASTLESSESQLDEGRDGQSEKEDVLENPNRNGMTEAFGCYPIISQITSHLDINSLSHLSITCRQIRVNLLQFRKQLLNSTLHCVNESLIPNPEHTLRYRARAADWYFVEEDGGRAAGSGKVGQCARDMVGGCRRDGCGMIVCRNCTIKPPAPILLQHRHRRLCKTCVKAPLESITPPSQFPLCAMTPEVCNTNSVFCTCPLEGVWLCQPCGRSLRSADATYESIWLWRTRYSDQLGGLGTGIGEGDRGVECGRGRDCLAAREVESETDCDAEDARSVRSDQTPDSSGETLLGSSGVMNGAQMGPGYLRHEIEGIGGKVKKKLVTMVKVGACVAEFEDEIQKGRSLLREIEGKERSWCGWCWRVIRGEKDFESDGIKDEE